MIPPVRSEQLRRPNRAVSSIAALAGLAMLASVASAPGAQAAQLVKVSPGFNGSVTAVAKDSSGNTYVGGAFTAYNSIDTGYGGVVGSSSGLVNTSFPKVSGSSGSINAVVGDGSGGYFIGGSFTTVNGVSRSNVAHITSTGAVGSWNPGAGNAVNALAYDSANSVVYIGGNFTTFGGSARNYVAAVSTGTIGNSTCLTTYTSGCVRSWNPNAGGAVSALAVDSANGVVYIGGAFTTLSGSTRNRLGAVSISSTGNGSDGSCLTAYANACLQSWDPNAGSTVNTLAVDSANGVVYIGGAFTTLAGSTRNRLGAVSTSSTGNGSSGSCLTAYASACLQSWDPNANGAVNALAVDSSNSVVYLGGAFTTLSGSARGYVGAVSTSSTGNGSSGSCLTAYASACLQSWDPSAGSTVSALAVDSANGVVYIGGAFTALSGSARSRLGAVSISSTGNGSSGSCLTAYASACLRNWNPTAGGTVNALAYDSSNSAVYIGGAFTTLGGAPRNNLAAFDSAGALTSWNPNAFGTVNALAYDSGNDVVYIGGAFTSLSGSARNRLGAVSTSSTGNGSSGSCLTAYANACLQSWDPNAGSTVNALAVDSSNSVVYIGGAFTTLSGSARNRVAAVSISSTGNGSSGSCLTAYANACLRSWNPNAGGTVSALAVDSSNSVVYLGGAFSTLSGSTRNRVGAVSTSSTGNGSSGSCLTAYANACLRSWNPNAGSTVNALAVDSSNSVVYIGGAFTTLSGSIRSRVGAVSTSSTGNGSSGSCLTAYANACLQSWDPVAGSTVSALAFDSSNSVVYLGGSLTTLAGSNRSRVGAVSTSSTGNGSSGSCLTAYASTCLQSWDPNADSTVNALAYDSANSAVVIGGSFTTVNSSAVARGGLASVSSSSGTVGSSLIGMPSPTLDTSAASISRGSVVKGDAWTGSGSTPSSYKWQRCTSSSAVDCSDISGAGSTGAWWGSRSADIGNRVRLKAVWDTIDSTLTAFSAITGVFTPTSTSAPSIDQGLVSGAPKVGTRIHSSFGVWGGYIAGSSTIAFQWQRCTTTDASSCTTNVGTNNQWYMPVSADAGNYLRVTATLTTNGQTATAASPISSAVASATQARRSVAKTAVAKAKGGKAKSRR